jgi:hypothetical protein
MAGRASALAVLELEPGADTAAIEQAYRRLIKQHHPDRQGGDGGRAAEINRAYRELRGGKAPIDPLQFNEDFGAARKRPRWPVAALVAGAAIGGLLVIIGPSDPLTRTLSAANAHLPIHHGAGARAAQDPIAEPLHDRVIDNAVGEAVHLFRTKDEMALASASGDCQRRFRASPGTQLLDRCAAFDDAVVGLQDRDPLRDEGPFAPLAVTGRQWSAASALSDDYLAIDSRLDQVRLRVEIALAPQVPPVAPANSNSNRNSD